MLYLKPFAFRYHGAPASCPQLFSKSEIVIPEKGLWLITGPSGSGKSTLLSLIKGLCPSYIPGYFEGEFYYKDQLIDQKFVLHSKNEIAYLFQNPFQQIIYQNSYLEFCFSAESQLLSFEEFFSKTESLIQLFNLADVLEKKTNQLSLGQAQKLLLASLLASKPKILLLDEPTAFLDFSARAHFYKLLSFLRNEHLVILVDHHISEVKNICDGFLKIGDDREVSSINKLDHKIQKLPTAKKKFFEEAAYCFNVKNVSYSYDRKAKLLNSINFSVKSPDIVAIKGENGAGKTTFLKLISGYLKPQLGKIDSCDDIGYVMQNSEDNFMFDTARQELEGIDQVLIDKFFPNKNLDVSPFSLSEGEKRRLSFLIHLRRNKKIILYDEPTFGLDEHNKYLVAETLLQFKEYNILQIIISHDDQFISWVADQVYELKEGQLEKL